LKQKFEPKYAKVKSKSIILTMGSEIIAFKWLNKKRELMTVSKEKNFTERLLQMYPAKHCT